MAKENSNSAYGALKQYIRYVVNFVYYRNYWAIGTENIPSDGTPLMIVSDHQNSLNDALGVLLSKWDRKFHFISRADVFTINPLFTKFLYWIGLLPAFRLGFEGEEALSNNDATFNVSQQNLLDGRTVVIYPEAGHQDKHWLGTFSYGYTRMAFGAAQMCNFEKEIFILPSCNHYSEYRGMRNDMMVRFGTPISLKPYYELFKEKPRTAQRQVNALVREQIKSMMLNIEDLENYEAIDWIRTGAKGREFAVSRGFDPDQLPQKLEADKLLVSSLSESGFDYAPVKEIISAEKEHGFGESQLEREPGIGIIVLNCILAVLLLPLALFGLWPSVLSWFIPKYLADKMKDPMLESSFVVGLNVLFILPVAALLTMIFGWIAFGPVRALAWTLLLPFICAGEWLYYKFVENLVKDIKYHKASGEGKTARPEELRKSVFAGLDKLFEKWKKEE